MDNREHWVLVSDFARLRDPLRSGSRPPNENHCLNTFPTMSCILRFSDLLPLAHELLRPASFTIHNKCVFCFFLNLSCSYIGTRYFHARCIFIFNFFWQKVLPTVREQTDWQAENCRTWDQDRITKKCIFLSKICNWNFRGY